MTKKEDIAWQVDPESDLLMISELGKDTRYFSMDFVVGLCMGLVEGHLVKVDRLHDGLPWEVAFVGPEGSQKVTVREGGLEAVFLEREAARATREG